MSDTQETPTAPALSPRLASALAKLRDVSAVARAVPRPDAHAVEAAVFLEAVARPGGIASTPEGQERTAEAAEGMVRAWPRPDLHALAGEPL